MEQFDVIIIGAGAAGLSAAQYTARSNLKTLVLDGEGSGGQALLIDSLENYPGFPESLTGEEFTERLESQARNFGALIKMRTVEELIRSRDEFSVRTDEETYSAPAVIIATGASHRHLEVAGEEEFRGRGVSYCATCDGPMFSGKKILVVGGGDAACDEASFLSKLTDHVVMVHRRDRFRAQKAVADRVLNNPGIGVRFNTIVEEIYGSPNDFGIDAVSSVRLRESDKRGEERRYSEEFDAVFIFIGSIPRTELAPFAETDDTGYLITNDRMETTVPGLYAVGDVRTTPFRQLIVAAADGAVAAHSAGEFIDELRGTTYGAH